VISDKTSKTILERQPCENCELKLAEIELLKEQGKGTARSQSSK